MDKAVVLLSGGMDSAALLQYVKQRIGAKRLHVISFKYGQRHMRELESAAWQAEKAGVEVHRVIDISFFGEITAAGSALTGAGIGVPDLKDVPPDQKMQPLTYVPYRNLVFLAVASAYAESAGIRDIFYGAQAQDEYGYWDCSIDFVKKLNDVLVLNRRNPVTVWAPFAGMRKADVLKIGLELGVDYSHTWTCYRGGGRPCGTCPSCVERDKAFAEAGAGGEGVRPDIRD